MFLLLLGPAIGVRLYGLDHRSLWLDEILDVFTLRYSWSEMWRGLQRLVYNPPLDYLIRKAFELLHPSDAIRRLPGILYGTCSVIVFGALVARRSSRQVGLAASALLAFAPYHVRYSQEVRPYSLALLLLCSSLFCLDWYLEHRNLLALVGLVLTAVLTAYTLYLAALMLIVSGAALLVEDLSSADVKRSASARRLIRWTPVLLAIAAITYIPWWRVIVEALRSPPFTEPPPY